MLRYSAVTLSASCFFNIWSAAGVGLGCVAAAAKWQTCLFIFDAAYIPELKWAISEAPDDKSAAAAHSREGGSG